MSTNRTNLILPNQRDPLRVMFVTTFLDVGGEETLLANLVRSMDRRHFAPELCCLKRPGVLGETLAAELPVHSGLLKHKLDLRVWGRLARLLRERRIDAVVTVGTGGDKMFWGRLAARRAGVTVVASALHSSGFPNRVEFTNRLLAPITDAFIAVAGAHAAFLASGEGCPAEKIHIIPNGVDTKRFRPRPADPELRRALGLLPEAPVAGIVAVLRPEKNHDVFLRAAAQVRRQVPTAQFLIVGDGPLRPSVESRIDELKLRDCVHLLGLRKDVPELLLLMDALCLTSDIESNPVSILEAMSTGRPIVATRVGSIPENVIDGETGFLVAPGGDGQVAERLLALFTNPELKDRLGRAARQRIVEHASLERMVRGYEDLITDIYTAKCQGRRWTNAADDGTPGETKAVAENRPEDELVACGQEPPTSA